MTLTEKAVVVSAVLLIVFALGVGAGVRFANPLQTTEITEVAKPEIIQDDGSIIVERAPTTPDAKPVVKVPKKAKVERVVTVTVQPSEQEGTPCKAEPVTVDLALVREPDGGKRVIVSSEGGEIIASKDIPVETVELRPRVWAAGASYDPVKRLAGVWLERSFGRFVIGADVNRVRTSTSDSTYTEGRIRIGLVF